MGHLERSAQGRQGLVDWVAADHHGESKVYKACGAGWLFLRILESLKSRKNYLLRI